jgi:hypothetical protein
VVFGVASLGKWPAPRDVMSDPIATGLFADDHRD